MAPWVCVSSQSQSVRSRRPCNWSLRWPFRSVAWFPNIARHPPAWIPVQRPRCTRRASASDLHSIRHTKRGWMGLIGVKEILFLKGFSHKFVLFPVIAPPFPLSFASRSPAGGEHVPRLWYCRLAMRAILIPAIVLLYCPCCCFWGGDMKQIIELWSY